MRPTDPRPLSFHAVTQPPDTPAPPNRPTFTVRLSHANRALALVRDASGTLLIGWFAVLVIQGLVPVATVYLTKPLVDGLQTLVGAGASWTALAPLLPIGIAFAALIVAAELLKVALQWIGTMQSELVQDHISDLIHAKAISLDMASFETADFLDHLYRVRHESSNRPLALLEGAGSLLQNTITVVGIGTLLLSYGAWIALALLAGTIPAFLAVQRASRASHDWMVRTTTDRRRAHYFGDLLTGAPYAAEMRLFRLGDHFRTAYRALRTRLRSERLTLMRRQAVSRLGAEGVAMLVSAATLGWMVWRALLGLATLGDIALFQQAFQRAQGLVRALFGSINQLYTHGLYLETLFEFLDESSRVSAPPIARPLPPRITHGIRFVDVTFRYPGTDRVALDRFDLVIPAGRTIAIVGANGAGKSTLIKLLARFYDPERGRVELDGIDLREVAPDDLHRLLTVMFQSPVAYQGSVRDNIAMSDLAHGPDAERLDAAALDADAQELIRRLPAGFDSLLGKAFPGGTELSGGEWQRIAMARAYYRRTPLIVLDEPTSQMDSWAEAQWFDRFHHLAAGATSVIVTHRLTIARRADIIHVMEKGRIVESGTHDELLACGGRYAASWHDQMRSAGSAQQGP